MRWPRRWSDRRVLTYGHALHADLVILESALASTGSTTTFRDPAGVERTMTLAVPGAHNVLNACAAYLCATEELAPTPTVSSRDLRALPAHDADSR